MIKKLLFTGFLIVLLSSCGEFVPPNESSQTTSTTVVEVPSSLYDLCSEFFEGNKSFTTTITVDVYENGVFQENYYTHVYYLDNNDSNYDNFKFHNVEVPDTGSYVVSITYNTDDCYVCCGNSVCNATDAGGNTWPGGSPFYRGVVMLRDQTSVPNNIYIQPNKLCF
jgi:uncharacterized membrane protein